MGSREFPDARLAVEYLGSKILERRALERRQKVLDDLQLIRNRTRIQEVVTPIPPGHDQQMLFEKLESKGIWEKVFAFVTSPSDVTSAYFACDLFKKHLEEKRKRMFLPEVFGVLRDTTWLQFPVVPRYLEAQDRLLSVKESNENRDVLNLRLVSKMWKKAADEHFIEAPLGFSQPGWYLKCDEVKEVFVMNSCRQRQCEFRSVQDVDRAMEALGTCSSSPPIIRTILVDDERCEDKESFYSKLRQFLDMHGYKVWGVQFHQENDFNYNDFCKLVSRLPNLKAMKLVYSHSRDNVRFNIDFAKARLRRMITQMPFPCIPSLELCKFYGFPAPGELLLAEVLRGNANSIKTVFLHLWKLGQDDDEYPITDSVRNALSQLRLEHFNLILRAYLFPENDLDMDDWILRMSDFDWPLKVLHFHYDEDNEELNLTYGTFFKILNRFSQTLVEVSAVSYSDYWPLFYEWHYDDVIATVKGEFRHLRKIEVWPLPEKLSENDSPLQEQMKLTQ